MWVKQCHKPAHFWYFIHVYTTHVNIHLWWFWRWVTIVLTTLHGIDMYRWWKEMKNLLSWIGLPWESLRIRSLIKTKPPGIFTTRKSFAFWISKDMFICFYGWQDEHTSDSSQPPHQNLWVSTTRWTLSGWRIQIAINSHYFTSRFRYLNQKYLPYVRSRHGVCQLIIWLYKVQFLHSRVLKSHWLILGIDKHFSWHQSPLLTNYSLQF